MKLHQEAESLDGRALRRIGVGFVVATIFGVVLAAVLVAGPHGRLSSAEEPLGARPARARALGAAAPVLPRPSETALYRRLERPPAGAGARLREYGWVDRDAGLVHVPVERAFELLSAEAARRAAPPAPSEGPSTAPATSALPARSAP